MKLLGSGKQLTKVSKVLKEIGDEGPEATKGLKKFEGIQKYSKEAEVAGEVGSKKGGALGERTYDTIDVDATDLTNKPSMTLGADDAGFPQLKSGKDDPFALKSGVDDAVPPGDVPFNGKKSNKALIGGLAAGGATVGLAGTAYMLNRDDNTKFPAASSDDASKQNKKIPKGPADPTAGLSPSGTTKLPAADKYKEAYDMLKLPDQSGDYTDMQSDLAKDINAANEIYEQTKDEVAAREMWDGIIKGIGHIAAGVYGKNTGLDLSGVKFDREDWDKKREMAQGELRDSINNARQKALISKDQIDRAYGRAKDQLDVDKSRIEAAERQDYQRATLEESGKARADNMKVELARLRIQAQEKGDTAGLKAIERFRQAEQKVDQLNIQYAKAGGGPDLKSALAAEVQQLEKLGREIGMTDQELPYTMADINSSDEPVVINNHKMKRMAGPTEPTGGWVKARNKEGKEIMFNTVTKESKPI